jgi:hypothetical protein
LLVALVATELLTALEKEGCLRCDSRFSASRPSKAAGREDGSLDKRTILFLTFVENTAIKYQCESVLIDHRVEEGPWKLGPGGREFKMRSVETGNARTSIRGLADGGWWHLFGSTWSNAVRLDQESISKAGRWLHRPMSKGF